jgi:hypothetical protein
VAIRTARSALAKSAEASKREADDVTIRASRSVHSRPALDATYSSVHPGNDALCRPRVLSVGRSERLMEDLLLNMNSIADRDEIRQKAACQGPPVRERQAETEVSEQRAGVRRMAQSRIEPRSCELVTFSNLDATREEDSQGVNGRPTNTDAGEHESQTGQLERSTGTIDASYTQEADQHADQSNAVCHIQGQQRSLVPIA